MPFFIEDKSAVKGFRQATTYNIKTVNPILKNKVLTITTNSFIMQNCGNVPCMINGNWTLNPGSTLQFGSSNDINLFKGKIRFEFKWDEVWITSNPVTGEEIKEAKPRVELISSDFHNQQLVRRVDHI